jgi:hypothetical protein
MRPYVLPTAALVAQDTSYRTVGTNRANALAGLEAALALIGRPNTAIPAMRWLNMPTPVTPYDSTPGAQLKPLNDGIIRIVGFGWFTCPHCKNALGMIQKELHMLPKGVEFLYVERTEGQWGGDVITPEAEVERIRHDLIDLRHYTFPIAIWAGPRETTPEGWHVPREFPMLQPYGLQAGPSWLVVDGHGVVRGTFAGEESLRYDWEIWRLVRSLVAERAAHPHGGMPAASVSATSPAMTADAR